MAAGNVTVKVIGGEKLQKRLDKLDKEGKRAVAKAINAHAKKIVKGAKERTPTTGTGRLKKSIRITKRAKPTRPVANVHATAFYAHFVEFGTIKMSPQPFMGPAFDEVADQIDDEIESILDRFL